jgi:large repetitive protein
MPRNLHFYIKSKDNWQNMPHLLRLSKMKDFLFKLSYRGAFAVLSFLVMSAVTLNGQTLVNLINGTNPLLGMSAASLNSNIRFVDIDGDGDQDGFVGQTSGAIEFFENTGTKTIPAFNNNGYLSFFAPNGSSTLAFGDLDGDGDFDLLVGDEGGTFDYYANTGSSSSANFTLSGSNPLNGVNEGANASAFLVDIDCDGDLDAFIGNDAGEVFYYKNTGTKTSPTFTKQMGAANPFNGVTVAGRSYLAFADADGDGDSDCLIGTGAGTIKTYGNVGSPMSPVFSEYVPGSNVFAAGYGGNAAPEWIDMNGDGDFDLVVGEDGGQFEYFQNPYVFQCGTYTQQLGIANPLDNMSATAINASSAAFCDVDGDGDKDAIVGSLNLGLFYYENTGNVENPAFTYVGGTLDAASPFFGMAFDQTSMPTVVDVDGDGDCDIFVGGADGTIKYIQNNGAGSFTMMMPAGNPLGTVDVGQRSAPTFGDMDGDGDFDCFIGEQNGTVRYFKNTGTANNPVFASVSGTANPMNGASVFQNATPALSDYDRDGDLDCFVGRFNGITVAYENQGNSNTPFMVKLNVADNPFDGISISTNPNLAFVDLDKNGMDDVFFGGNDGNLYFYLGSGCTVLPVEMAYFNATAKGQMSILDWMTATEQNNEGFYIQRSIDGENWETLDFVHGFGTTNEPQNYSYIDERPLAGFNYYRLKQVDYSEDFEYSDVRVVEFEGKSLAVNVYPNPVQDVLNIDFEGEVQDAVFSIFNISGQLVRQENLSNANNLIHLSDLDGGFYFIKVEGKNVNINQKIVKQ